MRAAEQQGQRLQRRERAANDFREIYEELQSIARATSDRRLQDRILRVCDRMAPQQIPPTAGRASLLTVREHEVLMRIALGHTNHEVAEQLSIMPTTVKTYLKNTMHKLGTRNRVETIHAARRAGLLG